MKGFFDLNETIEPKEITKSKTKSFTCDDCGLSKQCQTPKMKMYGEGRKGIMIIGEAPGRNEDIQGKAFVGQSGQRLREAFKKEGIIFERDCFITNAVRCRPFQNATPTKIQINACKPRLLRDIQRAQPKVVFLVGNIPFTSVLGSKLNGRAKVSGFGNWTQTYIPDQEFQTFIVPIYHPAYVDRMQIDKLFMRMWEENIATGIDLKDRQFKNYLQESENNCICYYPDSIGAIEDAMSWHTFALDYETTGLKPYREGHKIISASISNGKVSYAFPFENDNKEFHKAWRALLRNDNRKVAHNLAFEQLWTKQICGYWIKNAHYDTMLASQCLNNQKPANLKYLVYTEFGIIGYDDYADSFLKASKSDKDTYGNNAFNQIEEADLSEILKYNALDSKFTMWLYDKLTQKIEPEPMKGPLLLVNGANALAQVQFNGIRVHEKMLKEAQEKLKERASNFYKRIFTHNDVKQWNKDEPFNPTSSQHLVHLLYTILDEKVHKRTIKNAPSVDEEAVSKINRPFIKDLLEYRRWTKANETYLGQFSREVTDEFLHPFFHLDSVRTFRSRSSAPNFQNIPKRDEEVKTIIRSLIIPREGNFLKEYDYKGVEVSISACYNHDPNLIAYITDPAKDMHRDMAAEIFKLDQKDVDSKIRYLAKNMFVFPEFYGSYYEDIAPNLWEAMSRENKLHLKANHISSYAKFERHIQDLENMFWNEWFSVYADWKEQFYKLYLKNGFVESHTGFVYQAPMKKNAVMNYPIQGSAFHCLLRTLIMIQLNHAQEFKHSYIVGQIHDSLVADVHPSEEKLLDYYVWYYGTQEIREEWDWIQVPLQIEESVSKINGSWAEMEEKGYLSLDKK